MGRAPFQILAIPYRITNCELQVCMLHRSDCDQYQFVAGGGEEGETPLDAAKREIFEETGIRTEELLQLDTRCSIPVNIIDKARRDHWDPTLFVMPEYSFAFRCDGNILLSHEHRSLIWLDYEEAKRKLSWDSNRTAMFELACRLNMIAI